MFFLTIQDHYDQANGMLPIVLHKETVLLIIEYFFSLSWIRFFTSRINEWQFRVIKPWNNGSFARGVCSLGVAQLLYCVSIVTRYIF